MIDNYYFYNGMSKPEKIEVDDIIIEDNYKGDLTDDFINAHNEFKDYEKEDYNIWIFDDYGVFKNPNLADFQDLNTKRYGISKNEYLEDFAAETHSH